MGSSFASSKARELVEESHLDAARIDGSGRNGAITVADVRRLLPIEPPADLEAPGRELWLAVRRDWVLLPTEDRLLEEACRTLDELRRIEQALSDSDVITTGSKGQRRADPLLAEARAHRLTLRGLFDSLGISEAEADAGSAEAQRSHAGRSLARQRWSRRHGAAA